MTADTTLERAAATRGGSISGDTGLLILRLVFGLLFAAHGAQKLFGWFGGEGLAANNAGFEKMGFEPGNVFGTVAGLSEFVGGLLLALGAFTPLAAAIVLGTGIVIVNTGFGKGLLGGYEMGLLFAVVALAVAFTGPGRFSVDNGRPWARTGLTWGVISVAVAVAAALVTLVGKSVL
ncbi:DoxX family protein [Nocardia flavorosea]|uniref:DoxX family protein n=1 Tax=Nocardia flavorosea TaxID=53429 RepID=A0A846YG12_9NOCA|nr:DoxX family protein [Nocardia flavorosea]NKY58566.1 DoxX family protein [Nocardia flavorosea]